MEEIYLKLWNKPDNDIIPSSKRIIEDIHRVIYFLCNDIYQECGTAFHYLFQILGKRNYERIFKKKRGGKLTKNTGFGIIDYLMQKNFKLLI